MEVCEMEMPLTHWSCITYKIRGSILGTSSHKQFWVSGSDWELFNPVNNKS